MRYFVFHYGMLSFVIYFFVLFFILPSSPLAFLPSWRRAAAMTLRTVLLSLQALMAAAEPDDPQGAVVAKQVCVCMTWAFLSVFS